MDWIYHGYGVDVLMENKTSRAYAPKYRFCYEAANEGFRNHFWKFDYTHQLCNIHCPTLILVGEEDWICDPKCSKKNGFFNSQ